MSANGASPTPSTRDLNACEWRDRARHRLSSSVLSATVLTTALSTAIAMPRALPADDRTELHSRYAAAESKLKAGEHSPEVWQEILETLYRLDQPRKALGAARVAAKELAQHPEVVGYIARAYFRGGFADEAAKLFDKADPQIGDAVLATALSKLLHSEGRSRQALAAVLSGLEHAPDDPELLYQAALLQAGFGNNTAAAGLFESASKHAHSLKGYPKDLLISRARARALIYQAAGDKPTNAVTHTGAIPFRIGQNLRLPTVDVQINDHAPVPMLLDLGRGQMLSLDSDVAREAGVKILGAGEIRDLTGGSSQTQWALTEQLALGDCRVSTVPTQVYAFNPGDLPDVKGVVGSGLFLKKRMIVDFQQFRVTVEDSIPAASTRPSDQLHTPLEVRFLGGDQPIVRVQLKDTKINGVFDIGSPVSCFSDGQMSALQHPSAIRETNFGDIPGRVAGRIPFRIGRRTFAHAQTIALPFIENQTSSAVGTQIDMILGWDVFKQMRRFTIDAPARTVVIDWLLPRKPGPPPAKATKKPKANPKS